MLEMDGRVGVTGQPPSMETSGTRPASRSLPRRTAEPRHTTPSVQPALPSIEAPSLTVPPAAIPRTGVFRTTVRTDGTTPAFGDPRPGIGAGELARSLLVE